MFNKIKGLALAAGAAVALSAGSAAAVTVVDVGDNVLEQQLISPGGTVEFNFQATKALRVQDFIIQAIGSNAGADVLNLEVEVFGAGGNSLGVSGFGDNLSVNGSQGAGTIFLQNQNLKGGETFSITVTDGIQNNIGLQLVFDAVAPIPLPAGGLLLGSALLAGGLVARRRKAA
jgi:hypothetical protein